MGNRCDLESECVGTLQKATFEEFKDKEGDWMDTCELVLQMVALI